MSVRRGEAVLFGSRDDEQRVPDELVADNGMWVRFWYRLIAARVWALHKVPALRFARIRTAKELTLDSSDDTFGRLPPPGKSAGARVF